MTFDLEWDVEPAEMNSVPQNHRPLVAILFPTARFPDRMIPRSKSDIAVRLHQPSGKHFELI